MLKKYMYVAIDIIVAVIASILAFVYGRQSTQFVASYAFLLVAILVQVIPIIFTDMIKDIAYKTAISIFSLIYLVAQAIISIIGFNLDKSGNTILIISVIAVLVYFIGMLLIGITSINGDNIRSKEKQKIFFIDKVAGDLTLSKQMLKDGEWISQLDKVIDEVRYSDINSPSEASEVELKILTSVENIEKNIKNDRKTEYKNECNKLLSLLKERNMICKLYK